MLAWSTDMVHFHGNSEFVMFYPKLYREWTKLYYLLQKLPKGDILLEKNNKDKHIFFLLCGMTIKSNYVIKVNVVSCLLKFEDKRLLCFLLFYFNIRLFSVIMSTAIYQTSNWVHHVMSGVENLKSLKIETVLFKHIWKRWNLLERLVTVLTLNLFVRHLSAFFFLHTTSPPTTTRCLESTSPSLLVLTVSWSYLAPSSWTLPSLRKPQWNHGSLCKNVMCVCAFPRIPPRLALPWN